MTGTDGRPIVNDLVHLVQYQHNLELCWILNKESVGTALWIVVSKQEQKLGYLHTVWMHLCHSCHSTCKQFAKIIILSKHSGPFDSK